MKTSNPFSNDSDAKAWAGIPEKYSPAGIERRCNEARRRSNLLPAEEQMNRFLNWLKATDAGHQPC